MLLSLASLLFLLVVVLVAAGWWCDGHDKSATVHSNSCRNHFLT